MLTLSVGHEKDCWKSKTKMTTCGVSSLACFTAALMPSTVLLLAVPTAAAFSAVVPRRPAWVSKFPARSSKTFQHSFSQGNDEFNSLSKNEKMFPVTDLCPVGGIWRSSCSHGQQFDRSGSVTKNVGYFLSHDLLHVLPQVLLKAECNISPLDGATHPDCLS